LKAALRTEKNVRLAVLFGSAARGTDTATSDIDLLVDLRDPSLERVVDLNTKLTAITGRPVDVVRLRDAKREPLFLADIVAEGRVLVDRNASWPGLRRRKATLRHRGQEQDAHRARAALAGIDRLLAH
jgi:predicted nucleotidyltransferase